MGYASCLQQLSLAANLLAAIALAQSSLANTCLRMRVSKCPLAPVAGSLTLASCRLRFVIRRPVVLRIHDGRDWASTQLSRPGIDLGTLDPEPSALTTAPDYSNERNFMALTEPLHRVRTTRFVIT